MAAARPAPLAEAAPRVRAHPSYAPHRAVLLLASADLCAALLGACLSVLAWHRVDASLVPSFYASMWPVALLFPLCYAAYGLYPAFGRSAAEELRKLTICTSLVFAALVVTIFLLKDADSYSRATLLLAWGQTVVLVPSLRAVVRTACAERNWWGSPVAVAGPGAVKIAEMLEAHPRLGLRPVAVLSDFGSMSPAGQNFGTRRVILTLGGLSQGQALAAFSQCSEIFSEVTVIPDLAGFASLWVEASDLNGTVSLEIRQRLLQPSSRMIKRLVDLALVAAGSVVLLPLVALIAVAIKLTSRGPILYGQVRRGRGGRPFKAWKFRSMVANADEVLAEYLKQDPQLREEWRRTQKLRNDPRITLVGRFLRRTSLDELPQFWNVVTGEMSVVGPRPIVTDEIARYGDAYISYKRVTPGLTGLWQVSGRNRLAYEARVSLDTYYIRNWSPWLDLYILARTVTAVLLARGAY
ncbi:MAG: undecaprenyl-phosphate galactose phosphotransferase WbaP [Acidobacteriia bacterium]|nr:undecaprenyl-phosphate galactose phosphotransferase WbaP [Terriglobia bacterium]